jgi:hypothetical protein
LLPIRFTAWVLLCSFFPTRPRPRFFWGMSKCARISPSSTRFFSAQTCFNRRRSKSEDEDHFATFAIYPINKLSQLSQQRNMRTRPLIASRSAQIFSRYGVPPPTFWCNCYIELGKLFRFLKAPLNISPKTGPFSISGFNGGGQMSKTFGFL